MKALKKAIDAIDRKGALLVYPLDNRKTPPSLWHELHPRTEMRWEWDEGADSRVADLWRLREELSRSGQVVYTKWYRGRATFFGREDFVDLLVAVGAPGLETSLGGESSNLYDALVESSPLSTKELKRATELQGKPFESMYQKSMKRLFESGLVVGWGEVDDGAFPSLAQGATKLMFEDLWSRAVETSHEERDLRRSRLASRWAPEFVKFLNQIVSRSAGANLTW